MKKLKICDSCGKERVIWKRSEGLAWCQSCWGKNLAGEGPKIKPVSQKKQKQDQEYSKLRAKYLEKNPLCEIGIKGICTRFATDIHHTRGGEERNVFYLIQSTWKSSCRSCHDWVHNFPKEAKDLGFLK